MKLIVALSFCLYFVGLHTLPATAELEALSQEIIDYVNSQQTTWKAAKSPRFEGMTAADVKSMCGVLEGDLKSPPLKRLEPLKSIPHKFDARTKWPHCPTISAIRDQGPCASSWAIAPAECMSDRYCIKYNEIVNISSEDLLTCCDTCGSCKGGYPSEAWYHWTRKDDLGGIVTGGEYKSNEGCRPYTIAHCNLTSVCWGHKSIAKPDCKMECVSGYSKSYKSDKHFGSRYYFVSNKVEEIQSEIMTNGPVQGLIDVHTDFPTYSSGVYKHTTGSYLGRIAIKILGWGTEKGTAYWIAAASWSDKWGDKGFFKIVRGQDECGVESRIFAGEPQKYSGRLNQFIRT